MAYTGDLIEHIPQSSTYLRVSHRVKFIKYGELNLRILGTNQAKLKAPLLLS